MSSMRNTRRKELYDIHDRRRQQHHRLGFNGKDRGPPRGNRNFQQLARTGRTSRQMAGFTAGGDLEQPAWRGTSRAVPQPAGSRRSDLEGHPEPAAYRWRTAAAGGAEEGKFGKQGQPPSTPGRRRMTGKNGRGR